MKNILYLFVITVMSMSCQAQQRNGVALVSPQEFSKEIGENKIQLIDVRTPKEYNTGHIKGATNIHLYDKDFKERINKLDKKKTVYVYCKAGGRSAEAVETLKQNGFKNIVELEGGTDAWTAVGNRLEK